MKLQPSLHLLAVALVCLGLLGCSGKKDDVGGGEVVANVGSRVITLDELESAYERAPQGYRPSEE